MEVERLRRAQQRSEADSEAVEEECELITASLERLEAEVAGVRATEQLPAIILVCCVWRLLSGVVIQVQAELEGLDGVGPELLYALRTAKHEGLLSSAGAGGGATLEEMERGIQVHAPLPVRDVIDRRVSRGAVSSLRTRRGAAPSGMPGRRWLPSGRERPHSSHG